MFRLCALLLAFGAALLWQAPAHASGDFGCDPEWKLGHSVLSGCEDMALLAPGNDTRTNLLFLLFDKRNRVTLAAQPGDDPLFSWYALKDRLVPGGGSHNSRFADGEGSRCLSYDSGTEAFLAAVAAARMRPEERKILSDARIAMQPNCSSPGASVPAPAGLKSPTAQAFARYLAGARAFYDADFAAAATEFAAITRAGDAWVREAACYMVGRVELNRAQVSAFDEYGYPGDFAKVDRKAVDAAEAGFQTYLEQYPKGRYAGSARGLLRRVHWLGNDKAKLSAAYARLWALDPATRGIDDIDLANEIDDKLIGRLTPQDEVDPILLAVVAMRAMRTHDRYGEPAGKMLGRAELEAMRPRFASAPKLYELLLATYAYHIDKDYRAVTRLIPDAARQGSFTYLEFSRQMLRGMALEALKDRNARGFWLEMLGGAQWAWQRPAVELALAMNEERAGRLDRVFAPDSPIRGSAVREILLMYAAGPALLRQQARAADAPSHERDLALFVLLYKDLTRGLYRDFVGDLAMVPASGSTSGNLYDLHAAEQVPVRLFVEARDTGDFACPTLAASAAALAADRTAPGPRLCVADFLRAAGFDQHPLDNPPRPDQLGGVPSQFAGGNYSRLEVYKAVIADAKATGADKAYALYRAVMCYAPNGNNSCGGTEVPTATRKAWFQRLKKEYPASSWAKDLRYYW